MPGDERAASEAWQRAVQDRLDETYGDPSPRDVMETCAHMEACRRARRVLCGGTWAPREWSLLRCEECEQWEMKQRRGEDGRWAT